MKKFRIRKYAWKFFSLFKAPILEKCLLNILKCTILRKTHYVNIFNNFSTSGFERKIGCKILSIRTWTKVGLGYIIKACYNKWNFIKHGKINFIHCSNFGGLNPIYATGWKQTLLCIFILTFNTHFNYIITNICTFIL